MAAPDRQQIEAIVREVLARLRPEGGQSGEGREAGRPAKRLLAIFTGVSEGAEQALAALAGMGKEGWGLAIYVSPWGERTLGAEVMQRLARLGAVLRDAQVPDCAAAVADVDAVVVATLSRNTAAKVALLAPDSTAAELIVQALLKGKPVAAAWDGVAAEVASAPPALKNLVQGYLRTLSDLGVEVVAAGELGAGLAKAAGLYFGRRGGARGRVVLTAEEVEDALRRGEKVIPLPPGAIVTMAAEDRARELGIELRREEE